jgi:glutathione peroxidase
MSLVRIIRFGHILGALLALTALAHPAFARPQYALKEKVNCVYCHVEAGKDRNFRGLYYAAHDHSFVGFDNEFEAKMAGVSPDSNGPDAAPKSADYPNYKVAPALNFAPKNIDGKTVNLGRYQGSVILVVNVASKCGFTPQYAGLQKLYTQYKDKGFVILGFPANDFLQQEPGTNQEIKTFCTSKYNVTFPMFSKIVVKGKGQDPFYKFLTDKQTDPKFSGDIGWNFTKFLINRKGEIVARFDTKIDPSAPEVSAAIQKELDTPAATPQSLAKP